VFVPGTVQQVFDAIGENLPVIDDILISKIGVAFDAGNGTSYSLANREEVLSFLEQHRGKKVFTVSW